MIDTKNFPLYIASPLGFSEAGKEFYYNKFLPIIKEEGFPIIDPWRLTPQREINEVLTIPYGPLRKQAWRLLDFKIGARNAEGIDRAKGIVAILDGIDIDSGTSSEIGYGCAQNKKIIGYRGDFRLSSENDGTFVNLQVEYFIRRNGGKIITSINELKPALREIFLNLK
ncbi:MAG: nucleoside 2-deoxyribosyltransferase [Candidatus Pacearchaeota archaeon]|nr:nucleoside 2-deoxyribosyltransferase [Candidatus Pacearchaeota archaeon]